MENANSAKGSLELKIMPLYEVFTNLVDVKMFGIAHILNIGNQMPYKFMDTYPISKLKMAFYTLVKLDKSKTRNNLFHFSS